MHIYVLCFSFWLLNLSMNKPKKKFDIVLTFCVCFPTFSPGQAFCPAKWHLASGQDGSDGGIPNRAMPKA